MQERKMQYKIEVVENAGKENAAQDCRGGNVGKENAGKRPNADRS